MNLQLGNEMNVSSLELKPDREHRTVSYVSHVAISACSCRRKKTKVICAVIVATEQRAFFARLTVKLNWCVKKKKCQVKLHVLRSS